MYDDDFDEHNSFSHEQLELEIDENEMEEIKKQPFIMIKSRCGLKEGKGMIINFTCNDLFLKLFEIKELNLFNENEGYDGFRNLVTSNWLEFY